MQCYEHAKANQTKDAVAICSNCGAALCMEHLVVETEVEPLTNVQKRRIFCEVCSGEKKK